MKKFIKSRIWLIDEIIQSDSSWNYRLYRIKEFFGINPDSKSRNNKLELFKINNILK